MTVVAENLTKSFAGLRVLDSVGINVADGEIHALLGANGSGKSTLVKMLTGVYQPDSGSITVSGQTLSAIPSPHFANEHGIAVVHQEAPLIDTCTVAECIALFRGYPTKNGRIQWNILFREVAEMLERFDVRVNPRALAGTLSPAERALVSLIIALDRVRSGLSLLILDEVTASLPRDDAEPYLERVTELAKSGMGILMVTHRLAELRNRAARMTILRDGRNVYSGSPEGFDDDAIIAKMVGEEVHGKIAKPVGRAAILGKLWSKFSSVSRPAPDKGLVPLRVEHLAGDLLEDVSFELQPGEILGVAGLEETGISELPQILGGARPSRAGRIVIAGKEMRRNGTPKTAIDAGLMVLPADRLNAGGVRSLSVAENVMLPDFSRYWGKKSRERNVLNQLIADFDVRPPRPQALFGTLSGGNQQKVLLSKWLHLHPSVLVLDDPTSGVDPGARAKIFEILRDASQEGLGILFFSTEPEQLATMCSRVLVLRNGVVATELTGSDLTHQSISRWCYA